MACEDDPNSLTPWMARKCLGHLGVCIACIAHTKACKGAWIFKNKTCDVRIVYRCADLRIYTRTGVKENIQKHLQHPPTILNPPTPV